MHIGDITKPMRQNLMGKEGKKTRNKFKVFELIQI